MNKNFFLSASILIIIVFVFCNCLFSQQDKKQKKTPEVSALKRSDRMKKNLSLSEEQYKKVYNLLLNKIQTGQNSKEKFKSMDKNTRKQMKKQNKEEFQKQLEGILSKEQFRKFKENRNKYNHIKEKKIKEEVQ